MTCGECSHWFKGPPDPSNLTAPAVGQCRVELRTVVVPTPNGAAIQFIYPRTTGEFPACGQFKAREVQV